jgi:hypothetical protein
MVLEFELSALLLAKLALYCLSHTLEMRSQKQFGSATMILLILASQEARITGVCH